MNFSQILKTLIKKGEDNFKDIAHITKVQTSENAIGKTIFIICVMIAVVDYFRIYIKNRPKDDSKYRDPRKD